MSAPGISARQPIGPAHTLARRAVRSVARVRTADDYSPPSRSGVPESPSSPICPCRDCASPLLPTASAVSANSAQQLRSTLPPPSSFLFRSLVHPCVHPAHATNVRARTCDLRKIRLMRGEIGLLRRLFCRQPLRPQLGYLSCQIFQITLICRDERFPVKRHTMPGQNDVEIKFFQSIQRRYPLVENSVAHVRQPRLHQVACAYNALLGQKDHRISRRMAASEKEQPDFTLALIHQHG